MFLLGDEPRPFIPSVINAHANVLSSTKLLGLVCYWRIYMTQGKHESTSLDTGVKLLQ